MTLYSQWWENPFPRTGGTHLRQLRYDITIETTSLLNAIIIFVSFMLWSVGLVGRPTGSAKNYGRAGALMED